MTFFTLTSFGGTTGLTLADDPVRRYAQESGLAGSDRFCALPTNIFNDPYLPPLGEMVFYVVTGSDGLVESSMGVDSLGNTWLNGLPCGP